jgi:hypothetical protein
LAISLSYTTFHAPRLVVSGGGALRGAAGAGARGGRLTLTLTLTLTLQVAERCVALLEQEPAAGAVLCKWMMAEGAPAATALALAQSLQTLLLSSKAPQAQAAVAASPAKGKKGKAAAGKRRKAAELETVEEQEEVSWVSTVLTLSRSHAGSSRVRARREKRHLSAWL